MRALAWLAAISIGSLPFLLAGCPSSPPAQEDTAPQVEEPEQPEPPEAAEPAEETSSDAAEGEAIQLDQADFESEVLNSKLPVVVDFWAPWCGPCRAVEPVLNELAKRYAGKAKVVRMNVDENRELSGKYDIQYIPTLILIKEGKEVHRTVGAPPNIETELTAAIDDALSD